MSGAPAAEPGPSSPDRRAPASLLLLAGVALVTAGMALAIAGILVPALFRPGTFAILIGLLALAAGGIWTIFDPTAGSPAA